jgi:hypothetical protein
VGKLLCHGVYGGESGILGINAMKACYGVNNFKENWNYI